MSREKVVVAMSGGVDSSVAAALLCEQGYEVMGLFMRVGAGLPDPAPPDLSQRPHQGCCSAADAADARTVAGRLGIGFYVLDFKDEFDHIIDYFADEYSRGRTPNPCVVCNHRLKFGKLLDYADAVGARFIATGHHARLSERDGVPRLCRAVDHHKDQTYVLYGIDRAALPRILFPIGGLTKQEVRAAAVRLGLPVHDKPDSVEICFVPDQDYARLVRERRPEAFRPGPVVDAEGTVVGQHAGLPGFTIGQRRGLGIAAGRPIYVTRLNVLDNTITVGERDDLMHRTFTVSHLNFLVDRPAGTVRADVKIRYQHPAAPATVSLNEPSRAAVTFDEPQSAITPGQAAVFYEGDCVLGGGWIDEVLADKRDGGDSDAMDSTEVSP